MFLDHYIAHYFHFKPTLFHLKFSLFSIYFGRVNIDENFDDNIVSFVSNF